MAQDTERDEVIRIVIRLGLVKVVDFVTSRAIALGLTAIHALELVTLHDRLLESFGKAAPILPGSGSVPPSVISLPGHLLRQCVLPLLSSGAVVSGQQGTRLLLSFLLTPMSPWRAFQALDIGLLGDGAGSLLTGNGTVDRLALRKIASVSAHRGLAVETRDDVQSPFAFESSIGLVPRRRDSGRSASTVSATALIALTGSEIAVESAPGLRFAALGAFFHCPLPRYSSTMRRTNSATEIPSRAAASLRNVICGSVNEIICFFIPTVYQRVSSHA